MDYQQYQAAYQPMGYQSYHHYQYATPANHLKVRFSFAISYFLFLPFYNLNFCHFQIFNYISLQKDQPEVWNSWSIKVKTGGILKFYNKTENLQPFSTSIVVVKPKYLKNSFRIKPFTTSFNFRYAFN